MDKKPLTIHEVSRMVGKLNDFQVLSLLDQLGEGLDDALRHWQLLGTSFSRANRLLLENLLMRISIKG